jgi:hypothetical protein
MRVLITGAAGFIGFHLSKRLGAASSDTASIAHSFLWSWQGACRSWLRMWCSSRAQYRFGEFRPLTMVTVCYAVLAGLALGQARECCEAP